MEIIKCLIAASYGLKVEKTNFKVEIKVKECYRERQRKMKVDLCQYTAVGRGSPVLGLFNFITCLTCHCRQKEKQKEYDFTSQEQQIIQRNPKNNKATAQTKNPKQQMEW